MHISVTFTDELKDQVTEANQMNDTDIQDLVNVMENGSFQQQPLLSTNVVSSEVKFSDKSLSGSSGVDLAAFKIKTESPVDIFDDFDLVPLVDRQKMLLLRYDSGSLPFSFFFFLLVGMSGFLDF